MFSTVLFGLGWYSMIWYVIQFLCGMVCGTVLYSLVWFGKVGMVWLWYSFVWFGLVLEGFPPLAMLASPPQCEA